MKELLVIQQKLHSGKDKRNDFGKYNYRSAEGILENLKPILRESNCTVTLNDRLLEVSGRFYIESTATLCNETGESISVQSLAREDDVLKGMSGGQITGATSSYARKYALCGLFAIDGSDAKDLDDVAGMADKTAARVQAAAQTTKPQIPIGDMFDGCMTMEEVKAVWSAHKELQTDDVFKNAKNFAKERVRADQ